MTRPEEGAGEHQQVRLEHLEELRQQGIDPFDVRRYVPTHHSQTVIDQFDALEDTEVKMAGRLLIFRGHGKAAFADLQDRMGQIQLFARIDHLGEASFQRFTSLDRGDIVGVEGRVFKTRRGEITVEVYDWRLLSKALRPLPEKWHGLQDTELRYRQRYVDLVANPDVRETFVIRSRAIQTIREFLVDRGFLEVETPILTPQAGGAAARPFVTHHRALDLDVYLRIAPELYLKRLMVGGLERVFELGRNFRNEGVSTRHNPEYTMLEIYQAYADYEDMMELTEDLVTTVAQKTIGTLELEYQGEMIDLSPPWKRLSIMDALEATAGIGWNELETAAKAREAVERLGIDIDDEATHGMIIDKLIETLVEPDLREPTFLMDHPKVISPLAKEKQSDPHLTDRFEPFIAGFEIGNAFTELNDPVEQRRRFEQQIEERAAGNEEAQPMDRDFLRALEYGMPPTGGLGIGIDRLVMLLTDHASIREVILFPLMRPNEADN